MLKSVITDQTDKHSAHVDSTEGEVQALVVATRPLKTYENATLFFATEAGNIDMNVNGASSGTVETIYDEDIEWATSNIVAGNFVFDDAVGPAAGPHSGTVCINAVATTNNDTMQLNNVTDFDLATYSLLTGWINITSWPITGTKEVNIAGYDGTTLVGVAVNIGDYISTNITGWQQFVIPLSDMNLTGVTITALRIVTIDLGWGQAPNYWLDLIEFVTPDGDGQQEYAVRPQQNEWLHVHSTHWIFAIADSATVDGSNNLNPYDTLLGETLDVGIAYQRVVDGEIQFSSPLKQLSDLLQLPGANIKDFGGDGVNTWMTIEFVTQEPLVLRGETFDYIRLLVNDDLSNFLVLRTGITGKTEQR